MWGAAGSRNLNLNAGCHAGNERGLGEQLPSRRVIAPDDPRRLLPYPLCQAGALRPFQAARGARRPHLGGGLGPVLRSPVGGRMSGRCRRTLRDERFDFETLLDSDRPIRRNERRGRKLRLYVPIH